MFSSFRAKEDPDVYYCVSHCVVRKVTVGGPQELIDTIDLHIDVTSNNYAINHGLRVKYEPDFILSGGSLTTITILPPQLAEKLKAVQKELQLRLDFPPVISKIDGNFILSAAMDPHKECHFINQGVDVNELKADLWVVFE